jgi:hypothetical protein
MRQRPYGKTAQRRHGVFRRASARDDIISQASIARYPNLRPHPGSAITSSVAVAE